MRALPIAVILVAATAAVAAPRSLDTALAGRVAGPPRQCITLRGISDRSELFPGAILYKEGGTWFLNRPRDCDEINSDRSVASVTPSNRLCSGDIVRVSQLQSGFTFGSCPLGEFVPYKRAQPSRP